MTNSEAQQFEPGAAPQIQLRAAEWVMERYEAGQWNHERQVALDAWLAESHAHLLAYWRLKAAWERTHRLAALRGTPHSTPRTVESKRRRSLAFLFLAATAVVATVGGRLFLNAPIEHERVYATPVGGHETLTLADGSHVELNTATEIRVRSNARFVELVRGEAYFQIRHDSVKPFTVIASGHRVTDLGTKFLMREDGSRVQVTLFEGSVRFESASDAIRSHSEVLKPGDVAVATADSVSITQSPLRSLTDSTAWRNGMLVFRDATLAQAVREFNRYNTEKLVVHGARAADVKIDGTFHADNIAGFTDMAGRVFGLTVRRHGSEIAFSD